MKWREPGENPWFSAAKSYVLVKDGPDCWTAWGPEGAIAPQGFLTVLAAQLRESWEEDQRIEDLYAVGSRDCLGVFTAPEDAMAACEYDQSIAMQMRKQGEVKSGFRRRLQIRSSDSISDS